MKGKVLSIKVRAQESNQKSEDLEKHVTDLEQELENAEKKMMN